MSNETPNAPSCRDAVTTQPQTQSTVNHETLETISQLGKEIHEFLQLPPEDMAKIDHIEWKLDWKPVLTARLYPKNT